MEGIADSGFLDGGVGFEFVEGGLALSERWWIVLAPLLYLATLKLGQVFMQWQTGGNGFALRHLVVAHNATLSVVSAILFVDIFGEVVQIGKKGGAWGLFCDSERRFTSGRIYYLLYVNYLLKYVELGDTVLLVLRAKPLEFLHVYHHAATLVLCLTQLLGKTSLQWFVVVINLFVHIVMYAYYALQALRIDVWWKRYVTVLQIAQFVVVVLVCFVAYCTTILCPIGILDYQYRCAGDLTAATFAMVILSSYLILFLRLYSQKYNAKLKPSSRKTLQKEQNRLLSL